MPLRLVFSEAERERLGVLVNNLCMYAAQAVFQTSPELPRRALANLAKVKNEDEALLKRLDELARELGDESPLRVVEDLVRQPTDLAQMMTLVRRCLLASAFLGHCIAQPTHPKPARLEIAENTTEAPGPEKRLH